MKENKSLKEFIAESEELAENIERKIFELSDTISSGNESPDIINSIFRDFHSLKGISGMFGYSNLSRLAHELESLLDKIRLGKVNLSEETIELILKGKELILNIIKKISEKGEDGYPIDDYLEDINKFFTMDTKKEVSITQSLDYLKNVLTEYEEHRLYENIKKGKNIYSIQFNFNIDEFDERLTEITNILKTKGEVISTLPKPSETPGNIMFSIVFATDEKEDTLPVKNRYKYAIEKIGNYAKQADNREKEITSDTQTELKSISNTIRVDISKLDYLMNIVGEIVTQKSELARVIDVIKPLINNGEVTLNLSKSVTSLEKKINELQEAVMSVRMVPLNQLFEKLERNLRKISHEIGKEVKITIKGGDTELDKFIVEELGDPLMHIIRNSIDHGIEPKEERIAKGKPEYGQIDLLAYQKGNNVYIEVRDDGKGIDIERVRQKLINMGRITPEQEVSEDYLLQSLFLPGFSTKETASELSGRGVGLDVVKSNISRLRGTVEIKTQKNRGTSFILTLPLTLIIVQAIIIKTSKKIFAIPLSFVEEVVEIKSTDIMKISGEDTVNLRNSALPVVYLEEIFSFGERPENIKYLVVIRAGERKIGLISQEIVGQGDIVIKNMGKFIRVRGIAGATQIGYGKTVLVIDPPGILEEVVKV
ncbi:MAG: chemotaxis protein CheA [Proteobacteria bacterium]|nr:chemotaxis protein CheA [Pseudomonadota bacterium]